jgi:hypothetical protein
MSRQGLHAETTLTQVAPKTAPRCQSSTHLTAPADKRGLDFLVGFVLAQGIDGPDGCGQPAYEGELQDQTNDARKGATDGEESQEGQENRQE